MQSELQINSLQDDTLFESDRQYFPLSPDPSSCVFYLVSFEPTVSKTTRLITR